MQAAHSSLQHPHPLFELLGLINFFWLFHADHLSSGPVAVTSNPTLHRLTAADAILAAQLLEALPAPLKLANNLHFKRFTISYRRPVFA